MREIEVEIGEGEDRGFVRSEVSLWPNEQVDLQLWWGRVAGGGSSVGFL